MKHKDIQQLHEISVTELIKRAGDLKTKIAQARINRYTKPSKNVHTITSMRRDLSIIKTIVTEKNVQEK